MSNGMDWCCDLRQPGAGANLNRTIVAHLHRHAEDESSVASAQRVIEACLADALRESAAGVVWVSLNRYDIQPTSVGTTADCVADVELAVSEACANVLDHSGPGDVYQVIVELANRRCAISVIDKGHGFDFSTLRDGQADLDAESRRGVGLMRALVDRVQFTSEPQVGPSCASSSNSTSTPGRRPAA